MKRRARWEDSAACAGMDVELFFPDQVKGDAARRASEAARRVCRGCLVAQQCMDLALSARFEGIWAGTDVDEREHLRRLHRVRPTSLTDHRRDPLR